jgi:hypothetical protein
MANIIWDTKDFDKKVKNLVLVIEKAGAKALRDIAYEILRLSSFEVPHDTGMLQASGHVEDNNPDDVLVGYNKVYAARLHEHPEYRFQKGRKGKYLEDPIKKNTPIFRRLAENAVNTSLK